MMLRLGIKYIVLAILSVSVSSNHVLAQTQVEVKNPKNSFIKVQGTFEVFKIEKISEEQVNIWFKGASQNGKQETMVLKSDHLNENLKEGKKYRLTAETIKIKEGISSILKALVFFPNGATTIPIWMLSKESGLNLGLEKYLLMHAPSSDYIIF